MKMGEGLPKRLGGKGRCFIPPTHGQANLGFLVGEFPE